jgi:hypothetical protein
MPEIQIYEYLLQVAPALGISVFALIYLWKQYNDLIKYQREQDRNNLALLKELGSVLHSFESASTKDNLEIKQEIKDQAREVKQHIDIRVDELRRRTK